MGDLLRIRMQRARVIGLRGETADYNHAALVEAAVWAGGLPRPRRARPSARRDGGRLAAAPVRRRRPQPGGDGESSHDSAPIETVDLSKAIGHAKVHKAFLDPLGAHLALSLKPTGVRQHVTDSR